LNRFAGSSAFNHFAFFQSKPVARKMADMAMASIAGSQAADPAISCLKETDFLLILHNLLFSTIFLTNVKTPEERT
jgi:hypothetical protein